MSCPLLDLPGELRNRIYVYVVETQLIRLVRRQTQESTPTTPRIEAGQQFSSLTQACRRLRFEFSPIYKAKTTVLILPHELYDYIDSFLSPPGIKDEEIVGSILLDLIDPHRYTLRRIDIKPLLHLLRRAKNLHVSTHDIIDISTFVHAHDRNPTIQDILADLYDIHDMDIFLDYVEQAMTALELRGSEETGVEIVFELDEGHWEEWMAEWKIRNYIYDIVIEDDLYWPVHLCHCTNPLDRSSLVAYGSLSDSYSLALAQSCRKTRAEFFPLYKLKVTFHVYTYDVENYFKTFVVPPGSDDHPLGHIRILFPMYWSNIPTVINILPLMHMTHSSSRLKVDFLLECFADSDLEGASAAERFIDALLSTRQAPKFQKYLQEAITAIEVRRAHWFSVWFKIDPAFEEYWMRRLSTEDVTAEDLADIEPALNFWATSKDFDIHDIAGLLRFYV
ncbi:hypothetical protein N0V94_009033 [Neodidymelliopsis sp. IMI 364377]|nr:hypothetical protein N0V94_009033 [Neodidymelliopsis sp. IMI 364377]